MAHSFQPTRQNIHCIVLFIVAAITFAPITSIAQIGLSGATDVITNQYETYSFLDDYIIGSPSWNIVGGDISSTSQSGLTYYVNVYWTTAGQGSVSFLDGGSTLSTLSVNVSNPSAPPDSPIAGQAILATATSFLTNWNSVTGATSYRLDVSALSNFSSFVSGYNNLTVAATSQSVTGLTAGTLYYYRVRAINANGASGNSNVVSAITIPVSPTVSAGSGGTSSSFMANWGSVVSATSYRLDVSTSSSFASLVAGYNNLTVGGVGQLVTGLSLNTTYYYRVRAVNGGGVSSNSSTITMVTATSPPIPNAATSLTTNSFIANWSTVAGASSYRLDVSTVSNFASFVSGFNNLTVAGTSQLVTGLTAGTIYHFRIRAVNGYGSISDNSANGSTITVPVAPILNSANSFGASSFNLSWNSVSGATTYWVDVSTTPTFSSFVGTYNAYPNASTSITISALSSNTTYYVKVRAVNTSGTSGDSNAVTALTVPSPPISLGVALVTSNSFQATWAPDVNVSYRIDVSSSPQFSTFVATYNNLLVNGTSQIVSGLSQKSKYYFRVRAENSSGVSLNSISFFATNLDYNYIRTVSTSKMGILEDGQVETASIDERMTRFDFFDGLGRPSQSISLKQSPAQLDMVQAMSYDEFGREDVKYLPFTAGNDGWYKFDFRGSTDPGYASSSNPLYKFYNETSKVAIDPNPFAVSILEFSPLGRVLEQGSPGLSFQPDAINSYTSADRTLKKDYQINWPGEQILLWTYLPPSTQYPLGMVSAGSVASPLYYAPYQLSKTRTKDEQFNEVIEYSDKTGRVVLKRVQAVTGTPAINDVNYASTYYVYDDFGQLVYAIPPAATARLTAEFHDATSTSKETFMRRWAFRYKYDKRKRMILKQVPGADSVRIVYDNRDRIVLTQDGNQRTGATNTIKYWSFTKYDLLNRPILTGIRDTITTVQLTQAQMQAVVDAHYTKISSRWGESYVGSVVGNVHGYSNRSYPVRTGSTAGEVNIDKYTTVNYYDDYSFRNLWTGNWTYLNENLSESGAGVTYSQSASEFTRVVGQATGAKIKVLDGGASGIFTWLKSINYFDDRGRMIQSIADNYKGGTDRITNVLDFTGKVLKTKSTHNEQDVTWKDLVGTAAIGNKLDRTLAATSWAAGAISTTQLAAGQNGWIEIVVRELTTNRVIGLADTNPDANITSIDYGFYLNIATLKVYENGVSKLSVTGNNVVGDVLRIERNGTTVTYKRNGTLLYTSATASSTPLFVDVSISAFNTSVMDVRASFASTTRTTLRRFEYDHAARLKKVRHQLDMGQGMGTEVILLSNEYNELGQLVDKKLHSTDGTIYKQSVDYRYNIRGWLETINNSKLEVNAATNDETGDLFGMELKYNAVDTDISNSAMFNGNISGVKWSNYPGTGTTKEKGYTYGYDPLNRLLSSTYKEKTTTWNALANNANAESGFSYDLNGNILGLSRNNGMDALTYTYGTSGGNQLMKVADAGDKFKGFVDDPGNNATDDYTYDANGNMTRDLNKGIGNSLTDNVNIISYNFLNLPETVTKGGNNVRYVYDATGRKLWQGASYGGAVKRTDYAGEYIYENDALQFINHEEGRISVASNTLVYSNKGETTTDFTAVNATLALVTQNSSEKYLKVTSNGTTARTGVFPVGGTFTVVAGEQYRIRVKAYRGTGSSAAYIQAKAGGADIIWPGAAIASNIASESWTEQMVTIPVGATTLQVGVNWNTVVLNETMFINEIEVTKISTIAPEYQYHLKDHLGNVRTTFTSVTTTDQNTATLEAASLNTEQSQFLRIANAKRVSAAIFDHTNGAATGYSERLNGSTNEKFGVAKSISVMPGDVINAEVYAKYVDTNSSNWIGMLPSLMTQIAANQSGVVYDGVSYSSSTSSFPFPAAGSGTPSPQAPKAYLNWIIFDRNFLQKEFGFARITSAAREYGQDGAHELLSSPSITITEPGYVYIYLSNEETTPVEVYFDDFKVTHTKSPVVQVDDYYAFGLAFNSYTRENSVGQHWKFQGQEHQDELGLNWDSFKWRNHQPEIGRFFNVDPLAEKYVYNSPYAFSENKVTVHRELEGLEAENINSKFKKPEELKEKRPSDKAQEQSYKVTVKDPSKSFAELKNGFLKEPQRLLSNSKATFNAPVDGKGNPAKFEKGSFIKIDINGPANDGYVKVQNITSTKDNVSASFVTMEGHVEKGLINFNMSTDDKGNVSFSIDSKSEVDQGLAKKFEGYSRSEQQKSWQEVLTNFVGLSGGKETSREQHINDPK